MRVRREHVYGGLCHLFNAVPLWGLLFCGWIWFSMREESRSVVFHARQAITFHVLLMLGLTIYIALGFVARVVGVLLPAMGTFLTQLNGGILRVLLFVYVTICLYGAARCFSGQRFRYPLLGRRPSA